MSKIHDLKDGKLHIHKRSDGRSNYWVGRTFVNGNQIQQSSKTTDLVKAKKILSDWFDELKFQKKYNILFHDSSVRDSILEFLKWNDTTTSINKVTKKGYRDHCNMIMKFKDLMTLKMNAVKTTDIEKFINWRINKAKAQGKKLRGKTLEGNLTALAKFFNWAVKNGLRKEKLGNLKKLLDTKLRKQRTQRSGFTKEQYNHLLKVSRDRIKKGATSDLRFSRQRLHQFIIFMVSSGLRVNESIHLDWEDIQFKDRSKNIRQISNETQLQDDERYYLKINVRHSKTGQRNAISVASGYFAMQKLMKLYKDHGRKITGRIWGVKSFREGINALLIEAGLKTQKRGDEIVRFDSKSLRNTFMQFMLDKNISPIRVAKNCGTSVQMIEENYMANSRVEDMLDVWLQTGRTKLKAVS